MKNAKVRVTINVTCGDGSSDTITLFSTERSQGGDFSLSEIRQCGVSQVRESLNQFVERIEDMESDEASKIEEKGTK